MANREELGIIRAARAGQVHAQLVLGKLYLFGSATLPMSMATALHWLQRAAQQECAEAWLLIGSHIPFETAQHSAQSVLPWYERAFDDGVVQAGLVLAQLVLAQDGVRSPIRVKALRGLEAAALAGLPDAQWLLARHSALDPQQQLEADAGGQEWLIMAADNGVPEAQYAVLERAWDDADWSMFLQRGLPLGRRLLRSGPATTLTAPQALLLSRCAQVLANCGDLEANQAEILCFRESAALSGDRSAQLTLGLWFARMDAKGCRVKPGIAAVNFKRAIRWLSQAGEQGLAEAWFVLSRIHMKPEFSHRSLPEAQAYLERAADMGHATAQLECGIHAWRTRRDGANNDVRAVYWLLKAAAQGRPEAEAALSKIAPHPEPTAWIVQIGPLLTREHASRQPFLSARLELASLFHLSRAEALLLDINAADHGHCLVVDIRASYGRGKRRRLALLRTAQQRQALDRIVRLFDAVDCGSNGPEGNYRQRLYRLKTWLPGMTNQHQAPSSPTLLPPAGEGCI